MLRCHIVDGNIPVALQEKLRKRPLKGQGDLVKLTEFFTPLARNPTIEHILEQA